MGMYTELLLKCRIQSDISKNIKDILEYLFLDSNELEIKNLTLPEHIFFKTSRWHQIGRCSSYYHVPVTKNYIDFVNARKLFSRSDLKNYDNEINLFIDWLMPYLDQENGDCIGWTWYEEDNKPTLIYFKNENKLKN